MLKIYSYILFIIRKFTDTFYEFNATKSFPKFLDSDIPFHPSPEKPVILIGMHRSGTSLVTCLLEDLSLNMGKSQGRKTHENLFFQRRNELLLKITQSTWDNPKAFSRAIVCIKLKRAFCKFLENDKKKLHLSSFTSMKDKEKMWGFKDPRSTITLPIWLELFPEAKVINVIRNGHSVASSLLQRGKRSLERNQIPSLVSLEPSLSLDLWAEYVMIAHENCSSLPKERYLEIKYETLLDSPDESVRAIIRFLKIDITENEINKAISRIKHPNNPVIQVNNISLTARKALDFYGYKNCTI